MALNPFASVDEVEAVWGELTVAEEAQVEAWLVTASNNLRLRGAQRGVDVDTFIAGDELLTAAANGAVVESVRRRVSNPRALRQRAVTQAATPYSETESETLDSSASSGLLYFTDEEISWLPKRGKSKFRTLRAKSGYYQ